MKILKKQIAALADYATFHTKTDIRYLIRGGFWTTLGHALQVGSGAVATVALANLLPKNILGTYQFMLSMAGVLGVLTLSGLGPAVIRATARGHERAFRAAVRTKAKWSVSIAAASGGVALYYTLAGDTAFALSFLIIALAVPVMRTLELYHPYLLGKEAFRDSALLGFWRKPLPVAAVVTAAFFTHNIVYLVAAYFLAGALSYAAVYLSVRYKYQPPVGEHAETITLGKHLSILKIAGTAGQHLDKLLVWHFLGPVVMASYSIAALATQYTGGFLQSVSALAIPKLTRRNFTTLQQTLPRKVLFFAAFMAAGALVYIALAPLLFSFLFPAYPESVLLTQLLALTLLFQPRQLFGKTFIAHNMLTPQYVLGLGVPAVKMGALLVLLPMHGVLGAVAAVLCTELFATLLAWYFFKTSRAKETAPRDTAINEA